MWASLVLYWSMHVGKRAVRSATSCLEMKQCVCRAFAVHMYVHHRRLSRPVNVVAYQRFLESSLWDANASESRQQVRFLSTLLLPLPSRGTLQCGVAKGHRIPYRESSLALPRRVRGFGGRTRGGAPTSPRGRADCCRCRHPAVPEVSRGVVLYIQSAKGLNSLIL